MTTEKKIFVSEIKSDDQLVSVFICRQKNSYVGKTGLPYLSMSLTDKTGSLDGKVWDNVEKLSAQFKEGDYVKVKATASTYNGKIQLRISNVRSVDDHEVDPADFLPTGPFNSADMLAELQGIIETLPNVHIKTLLLSFLDDEDFVAKYKLAPAAKEIHHPYLGGLLEHTLSLANVAKGLCVHYKEVDLSLLMAGVFFHDIGKVKELEYTRSIGYTDEGRLIGHISIGLDMVNQQIAKMDDFPETLRLVIGHLVLSHHGQLEFGSPKRPKIIEAQVLSAIDDLDARIFSFSKILKEETTKDGRWTNYQRMYNRYLYRWQDDEPNAVTKDMETPDHRPTDKPKEEKSSFSNSMRITGLPGSDDKSDQTLDLFNKKK